MTRADKNGAYGAGNFQLLNNQINKLSQPIHNYLPTRLAVLRQRAYQASLQPIEVQSLLTDQSSPTTTSYAMFTFSKSLANNSVVTANYTPISNPLLTVQESLQPLLSRDYAVTASSAEVSTKSAARSPTTLTTSSFSIQNILSTSQTKTSVCRIPINGSHRFFGDQEHVQSTSPLRNSRPLTLDAQVSRSNLENKKSFVVNPGENTSHTMDVMRVNFGLSPMKPNKPEQRSLPSSTSTSSTCEIRPKDSAPSSQTGQTLNDTLDLDGMPTLDAENSRKRKRSDPQMPNYSIDADNKTENSASRPQLFCYHPRSERILHSGSILERHLDGLSNKRLAHEDEIRSFVQTDMIPEVQNATKNNGIPCPGLSITKKQLPQTRKPRKCQCPNCCVEGGNNTRDSKNRLLHKCHIPNCGRVFTIISRLKNHVKCHSSENPYHCTWAECGQSFVSKKVLGKHIKWHQLSKCPCTNCSVEGGNKTRDSKRRLLHACPIAECERVFIKIENLLAHVKWHSEEKLYRCTWATCGKTSFSKYEITKHMDLHEKSSEVTSANCSIKGRNNARASKGDLPYACHFSNCEKIFRRLANLNLHLKRHRREKSFYCGWNACEKSFITKPELIKHMTWHEELKKCPCANCEVEGGNKTKDPVNGKPQHICPIPNCGRIYSHTGYFKSHLKWHKGKEKFICKYCDKEYAREDKFVRHVKTHMGLRAK